MPYVRYNDAISIRGYSPILVSESTQAKANAAAGGVAYVGEIDEPLLDSRWWIRPVAGDGEAAGTVQKGGPPAPPANLLTHRTLHDKGLEIERIGEQIRYGFSTRAYNRFHDYLFRLRQYHFIIATHGSIRHSGENAATNITAEMRNNWHTGILAGPTDIDVATLGLAGAVKKFLARADSLKEGENALGPLSAPATWLSVLGGNDARRAITAVWTVNMSGFTAAQREALNDADLAGGSWIDGAGVL